MKKPKIKVNTVNNGYTLDVDDKSYMYFNAGELLAGILAHVGMEQNDYMTNEDLLTLLFDALLGTEHAKKLSQIRRDIVKLESDYTIRLELLDKTYKRVKDYENMADSLHDRISRVRDNVKSLETDCKDSKPLAEELLKGISSLNMMTYKLKEEMKESRALIREMKMLQHKEHKDEESVESSKPKPKKHTSKSPDEQAAAYERNKQKKLKK